MDDLKTRGWFGVGAVPGRSGLSTGGGGRGMFGAVGDDLGGTGGGGTLGLGGICGACPLKFCGEKFGLGDGPCDGGILSSPVGKLDGKDWPLGGLGALFMMLA